MYVSLSFPLYISLSFLLSLSSSVSLSLHPSISVCRSFRGTIKGPFIIVSLCVSGHEVVCVCVCCVVVCVVLCVCVCVCVCVCLCVNGLLPFNLHTKLIKL